MGFINIAIVFAFVSTSVTAAEVTYIGAQVRTLTPERASQLQLSGTTGAEIVAVDAYTPADRAGLRNEDVIVGINGLAIDDANQLIAYIQRTRPQTLINLAVVRNGRPTEVQVVTGLRVVGAGVNSGEAPPGATSIATTSPAHTSVGASSAQTFSARVDTAPARPAYVGLRARALTPERAAQLNITAGRGAEVTVVDYDSPASKAGILVGDVVLSYETLVINDATDLQRFIRETPAGASVRLGVIRESQRVMVPVQTSVRGTEASTAPPISDSILGCLKGAGIVLTTELVLTGVVCSAEAVTTGETSFCDALLDAVLDDAPGRAIKACMKGSNVPLLNAR